MRAVDKASRQALEICTAITMDIINSAARKESLEDVLDSFGDILAIDSPGLHLNTFFWDLPTEPMDLELEECTDLLQNPPSQVLDS